MEKYYDEAEIKEYIDRYRLYDIIPDIREYGEERLKIFTAKKGERLYPQNETEKLIFLVDGVVKNYALTKNGRKLLLHFSEAVELLRDLEFLNISNLSVGLEPLNRAKFLEINLKGIRDDLLDNNDFLRAMLRQIGGKLSKTTIAQTMTAVYPLESRLGSYLLYCTAQLPPQKKFFDENLVETAELLGCSYRHLLRTLKDFCTEGALEHTQNGYKILDEELLSKKASDRPIYGKYHGKIVE